MNNIVWLSPTWTTVFILAVVTLLVTTFWDNIKKVFTKNNDGEETSVSAWSKFNNFVSNSLAITIARYFLSVAVLSFSIYITHACSFPAPKPARPAHRTPRLPECGR